MKKVTLLLLIAASILACNKKDKEPVTPTNNMTVDPVSKDQIITIETEGKTYTAKSTENSPDNTHCSQFSNSLGSSIHIQVPGDDFPFIMQIYGVRAEVDGIGLYKNKPGGSNLYGEMFDGVKKGWFVDSFDIDVTWIDHYSYKNEWGNFVDVQRNRGTFKLYLSNPPNTKKTVTGTFDGLNQ